MKYLLLTWSGTGLLVLLLLLGSCTKSTNLPPVTPTADDLAGPYTGTYGVTETATIISGGSGTYQSTFAGVVIRDYSTRITPIIFDGRVFEDTLNVISFVQTGRTPAPAWAVPRRDIDLGSDTITFKVFRLASSVKDTIVGAYGGLADVRILRKDSLAYHYTYGWGVNVYDVHQIWVKQ